MIPHWQAVDEERDKEGNARRINRDEREFIKRLGTATTRTLAQPMPRPARGKRRKNYIGRKLKIRQTGEADEEDSDSASDSPMEVDNLAPSRRLTQTGFKAARKLEWPPQRLLGSDSSEETTASSSSTSKDSTPAVSDEDLAADEDDELDSDIEEIVVAAGRAFDPFEIEILPGPPRAPTPLPVDLEMMKAINALSLSSVRMQQTKQLPFLRRNLLRGFTGRCRQLGLRTKPIPGELVRLRVRYDYGSETFRVRLRDWACPLSWDHETVPTQWVRLQSGPWSLRLTIPEPPDEEENETPIPEEQIQNTPHRGHRAEVFSPFPFVALSPPAPQPIPSDRSLSRQTLPLPRKLEPRSKTPPTPPSTSVPPLSTRNSSVTATATATPVPPSRSRSTTAATTTTTRTTTTTATTTTTSRRPQPRADGHRYPTPPPPSNPLGPSAQPPYLPAKSEYNGPDIYYSCRPGGPCLLDLLNTLPLEPYGVLAWDILDREDEIYDSDNLKDEYKVMHALWARWIILNRAQLNEDV
ncbi:hypothetical protein H0H92_003630 [Tricholoma furcatifolium]|nr:hypothetical protein H0H92_003630 [Tricholoma furcatifolium]